MSNLTNQELLEQLEIITSKCEELRESKPFSEEHLKYMNGVAELQKEVLRRMK